jgi:hypothetical protein
MSCSAVTSCVANDCAAFSNWVAELAVELHLQLPLVTDHRGRLLGQRLVRALGLLDGLLDLYLRVGVLVDLRREGRHEVLPELHERVGHLLRLPSPCWSLLAAAEPRL